MKFNDNIFYYLPRKSITRGSLGSSIFIVKDAESNNQFMIDSGATAGTMGDSLLKKMKKDGIDIGKTQGILLTHSHPDHIAGIPFFRKHIGDIPVYYNPDDFISLENPHRLEDALLEEMGPYRNDVSKMPASFINIGFGYLYGEFKPIDNLKPVVEGQKIYLNKETGEYIEVFKAGGHIAHHMAYLLHCADEKKVLFSGDIVSFKKDEHDNIISLASLNTPLASYTEAIKTLQKLKKLDIDVLFTGHYGYYEEREQISQYFEEAVERIKDFEKKILECLKEKPLRIPEITKQVITMKNYLSGYATRTSTIFAILKHLLKTNLVSGDEETMYFSLNETNATN